MDIRHNGGLQEHRTGFWKHLLEADTWFYEVIMACFIMAWGVFVSFPSWRNDLSALFHAFMDIFPSQAFWSVLLLAAGFVKLLATAHNWFLIRRLSCLFSMLLWCFITLVFARMPVGSPGVVTLPFLAVGCALAYRNIGRSRQLEQRKFPGDGSK